LDEYPSPAIEIVKDVTSNDGSGSLLASSSVNYGVTSAWYEVQIDWLASTTINVTVFNPNGTTFATLSTSDSTYSSGGVGFAYWFQHGGWDYYTSRPYVAAAPTGVFGAPQQNNGATWAAAEDATLSGLSTGSNIRLRFSVVNTGSDFTSPLQLEYAAKGSYLNCESVPTGNFTYVPVSGSCGISPACMAASAQFTNFASTSPSLTYPASFGFSPSEILQNTANETNNAGTTVTTNTATEVEYNFQMTNNASDNAYCFRSTKHGTPYQSYDHIAQATILHAPTFGPTVTLNSVINPIVLIEGTTTLVLATSTVTDLNGYADMVAATSTFYRSGVGPMCTTNDNNCYQVASSSCSFSNCSGTSCLLTCSANMQYIADPTDSGSPYFGQHWYAHMSVIDSTNLFGTATSSPDDVGTLRALAISTSNIDFHGMNVGDYSTTSATTTVVNTGNSPIDIRLTGTSLSNSHGDTIDVGQLKFASSTFSYGSCALCLVLSGSATNVNVNIAKPTSTSTPSTGNVFWGINIPTGTPATGVGDPYTGTNTFEAATPG
jgi:hypothetical protein